MIIKHDMQVQKVLDFIETNDILAYDVETTGLNVRKDTIIGFGISNAVEGFYVAHKAYKDGELHTLVSTNACVKILKALMLKKLLMFNGSFDIRFTKNYFKVDLTDSLYCEVMLLKHTVDEERPMQLKPISKKLFGDEAISEQQDMLDSIKDNGGSPKEYYKADLDLMGKYCIMDCILTFKVYEHYSSILKSTGMSGFYYNDEVINLYRLVTVPMEESGVILDIPKLEQAHKDILKDIEAVTRNIQKEIKPMLDDFEKWYLYKEFSPIKSPSLFKQALVKYAGLDFPITDSGKYSVTKKNVEKLDDSIYKSFLTDGSPLSADVVKEVQLQMFEDSEEQYMFNLSSKDHLKRLFFSKLEEEPVSKTDKGNPQVDHLFLMKMSEKYEWVNDLIVLNKLNKIEGTYIGKWLVENEDGVFYPSWFNHRTTSGRYGGDLMQMSRKLESGHPLVVKYTNMIRDFIIAGEGYKLVGADYAALEVAVFADDAGDKPLLDIIRNDYDFYSSVALGVHELGHQYSADKNASNYFKKHEPKLRQDAKPYSLGIRYGMKSYALSKTLNISETDAKLIIDKYFESYPKLKTRMDNIIDFAKKHGYIKSKGGRVRHMPLLKSLASSYGDDLMDGLKLWKKYHESPGKYKQIKYLSKQYRGMINNALNFPIQSYAATIVNKASIALVREFRRVDLDATIILNIHDEIVVRCKERDAAKVARIMQYIMENTTKLSVPLLAEPQIGDRYGEIK